MSSDHHHHQPEFVTRLGAGWFAGAACELAWGHPLSTVYYSFLCARDRTRGDTSGE